MTCPVPDDLLRDALGELTVNKSAALRAHVEGCAACERERAALRITLDDLSNPPASADEVFVARVEAAARAMRGEAQVMRAPLRPWAALGRIAAAAAVLTLGAVPAAMHFGRTRTVEAPQGETGTFAARGGGGAPSERLRAEVLLVRDGQLTPLAGQSLRPPDVLAVRVTNLSGSTMHLMAFARDAAGDIHWLYPMYRDALTNPSSVAIVDGVRQHMLDEVVQPDAPASGPLRLVTLVSREPLTVKDVESRLAARPPTSAIAALFPGAMVAEWTVRWEGRP